MTISKLVFAKIPHFLFENISRQFKNLSLPTFLIFSSRIFFDNFKTCLCQISSSSLRVFSLTISKLVFAKFPQVLFENILGHFQNVSLTKFLISSSRTLQDNFKTCLCQFFSSPLRKHSKTISKLVLAKFPPLLFENILRRFQNLSLPNFLISSSKIFYDNFKTCLCQTSSSPLREHSKTISKLVFAKFPHLLFENISRQFQNLSLSIFLISFSKTF